MDQRFLLSTASPRKVGFPENGRCLLINPLATTNIRAVIGLLPEQSPSGKAGCSI
jgi:hypothetical protein